MIRLEGLATDLRNKKSLVICSSQHKQPDFQEFVGGTSTERSILLHGKKVFDPLSFHWFPWSCILGVASSADWNFALSYLSHMQQKASICFVDQTLSVPELFLQKLPRTTTFVQFYDTGIPFPALFGSYDYIFFPVAPPDTFIYSIQSHNHFKQFGDLKEIFRELSVAGLGLCWSREDNSLYWYEPGSKPHIDLNSRQIGNVLISIGEAMGQDGK
jgi:hypothetical protein